MRAPLPLPTGPPMFTGRRPGRDSFAPPGTHVLHIACGPGPDGLGQVVEAAAVVVALIAVGQAVDGYLKSRTLRDQARHTDERIRQAAQITNEILNAFVTPATSREDLRAKLLNPVWSIHTPPKVPPGTTSGNVSKAIAQAILKAQRRAAGLPEIISRRVPAYAVLWDIARALGVLQHMPRFQKWAQELGLQNVPLV